MDMSGMSGMGGMDMGSGMFTGTNKTIAHGLWYGIAGSVGMLTLGRAISWYQSRKRQSLHRQGYRTVPSRPDGALSESYAALVATFRELSYPQPIWFSGRFSKYFSPPPLGRCLLLAFYWIVILTMLWSNAILHKDDAMYAYKWEKVGFRAAWVSVTQIPFVYLLSCKFNPISLLTGISYERFNWLHRWAARTVFLTVIVHWSFFFREWWLGNYVKLEFEMMPMVKYGFGAWSVIGWMILSGFGYVRAHCYELFVLQHIAAAATLLWLIFMHVPVYARYNVWMSVAFLVFDWGSRIVWGVLRNTHVLGKLSQKTPGYSSFSEALPGDMVRLTLDDVDFTWRAGQHIQVCIPSLRPFEQHPFSIANTSDTDVTGEGRPLTLLIKARSGLSRSLYKAAQKDATTGRRRRVLLHGPLGMPPDLLHYETVVLIACSTGASFVVPMLQELVAKRGCVHRLSLHWIIRSSEHQVWFARELQAAIETARHAHLQLQITVHITQTERTGSESDQDFTPADVKPGPITVSEHSISGSSSASTTSSEKAALFSEPSHAGIVTQHGSRPSVESMIRPAVEAAVGETAVVTCGGMAITAQARTFVAALSDERAVHKGTGAQGIYLFTETYGW